MYIYKHLFMIIKICLQQLSITVLVNKIRHLAPAAPAPETGGAAAPDSRPLSLSLSLSVSIM